MKVASYTKTGSKSTSEVTLDNSVFNKVPESTQVMAQVYEASRVNARTVNAKTKTRSDVRGGGRKPWRQKGTGRARAGSIRSPIWRGGGITFGPIGDEKSSKVSKNSSRSALRHALSLSAKNGSVKVIETFECKDGKVKPTVELLSKIEAKGSTTIVVSEFDDLVRRATGNIPKVYATSAMRLNVNDVLDSDTLVISKKALEQLSERLGGTK